MASSILLVDDDPGLLRLLSLRLEAEGFAVDTAESGELALRRASDRRPDLVITDLCMDGMDGIALLDALQRRLPGLPIILITAHGTIPDAVKATQQGAFGFLTKPVDKGELLKLVQRAVSNGGPANTEAEDFGIVTRSPKMRDLLSQIRRVADSDASVLIQGDSGTGKELVARAIHAASPRADRELVAINCGALPENLLEGELFGYQKGAFTGATRNHPGLIQNADGGTLFLDEIGDMPQHLQVKLLRVLQERKVRPLGALDDTPVDVRVISATHRDLEAAIDDGQFREDLYYRLHVVGLNLPPLTERREDIPLLARHALQQIAARRGTEAKVYSPEAMEWLVAADWPGNVRQLLNVVEQNVALSSGSVIAPSLVEQALGRHSEGLPSFDAARDEFIRNYLAELLRLTRGNVSQAARLAGRHRTDFYKLLNKHGLSPDDYKA